MKVRLPAIQTHLLKQVTKNKILTHLAKEVRFHRLYLPIRNYQFGEKPQVFYLVASQPAILNIKNNIKEK